MSEAENQVSNKQYIRTPQLAVMTGVSRRFWERKRLEGTGPAFIRLSSKAVIYEVGAVLDWLEKRRQKPKAESEN